MIITTGQKVNATLIAKVKQLSEQLQLPFVARRDRSIETLYNDHQTDQLLVVLKETIKWYRKGDAHPFFFHPGLSVVRIKRLLRGDNDIMIKACQINPGDSFLDCTLGLAADAIVASYAVGEKGKVVGIESEPLLAFLVEVGLKQVEEFPELDQAARQIEVLQGHHLDILATLPDNSFDVVYFDPMFRQEIKESTSLQLLRSYANVSPLLPAVIDQAKRVAKKRVVLKERNISVEWERLGFRMMKRENMGIAYGILEIQGE